jgi:DNA-binding NarL/FixJ family response regulator
MTRVLIADSHPLFCRGVSNTLANKEIEIVGEAYNFEEMVSKAKELNPDVIIVDTHLLQENGTAVVDLLRLHPKVKLVCLMDERNGKLLDQAVKAEAVACLLKSITANELTQAMRQIIQEEAILSPKLVPLVLKQLRSRLEPSELTTLTQREREILSCLSQGNSSRQIAEECFISESTVRSHLSNIMSKLKCNNKTELMRYALGNGLSQA